jgi:cysteinyl-tRNA synthetase
MSTKYLGETLDIHTGGEDHIAIHHPNEIAQSEAATGRPFVHYWVHGRFLRWSADERRMSKRSGEFLVVDDLTERGYDPLAFRYHCLTASYRVPLTFSWDGLDRAAEGLGRMQENVRRLAGEVGPDKTGHAPASGPSSRLAEQSVCELPSEQFAQAVADDLDMPSALAVTWETIHQANRATDAADQRALLDLVIKFDRILGLGLAGAAQDGGAALPIAIVALVKQREAARSARDWATADALRQAIRQQGYELEDTPTGTRWRHLPANREGSR